MSELEDLRRQLEEEKIRTEKYREKKKIRDEIKTLRKERYDGDLLSSMGKAFKGAGKPIASIGKTLIGMGEGAHRYYGTSPLTRDYIYGRPYSQSKKRKGKRRKSK